jgi:hypothetical protein
MINGPPNRTVHYKIIEGTSSAAANTAIMAVNSVTSFGHDFVVVPPAPPVSESADTSGWKTKDAAYDPSKVPGAIPVSAAFTLIFTAVLLLTVLSGAAEFVMALAFGDHPTGFQQTAFSAMDFAWKAGFGAIVGLLGGKQTK